jgi:hypothetical protein
MSEKSIEELNKIKLMEQCGLVLSDEDRDEEGELEFIGTKAQWDEYNKLAHKYVE